MNPEESPAPRGQEVTPPTYSELRERRRAFRDHEDNEANDLWEETERFVLGPSY